MSGEVNNKEKIIYPKLENIDVMPSKKTQTLKSEEFYGFNQVIVAGDENLEPNNIISSKSIYGVQGTFDCDAKVDIASYIGGTSIYEFISRNPAHLIKKVNFANIDLSGKTSFNNLFRYCQTLTEAIVNMDGITTATQCFERCIGLKNNSNIKLFNTGSLKDASRMFYDCINMTETIEFDTSSIENVSYMYRGCKNITTMKHMDLSSAHLGLNTFFADMPNLRTIESISNIGKAYTEKTENYSLYEIRLYDASYIDAASVLKVIEGLADLNEVYDVANGGTLYRQRFSLGTAHKNKVTEAQKQIAINKGWNVSG